jgi:flavin reductase (DIM6/NTAB) family NADH-FMN oxidoreductase RutF
MPDSPAIPPSELQRALGKVPSGLFVLSIGHDDQAFGILVSWVQQAGFDPPSLTVALRLDRPAVDRVTLAGAFTLSQLPEGGKTLLRHFARGTTGDEPIFQGVARQNVPHSVGIVPSGAMAFLDLRITGHVDSGDHRIILATITQGAILDADASPVVHIRKSGSHY